MKCFIQIYSQERTKNAQFIIISLRSNMFELADYLVGIYKVEDCTRSLTIQNYDKQRVLGYGEKENLSESMNISSDKENSRDDSTMKVDEPASILNNESLVSETISSPPMSQIV